MVASKRFPTTDPRRLFSKDGESFDLLCPECGFDYVCCDAPYVDATSASNPKIVVPFECEHGHRTAIEFTFYKGRTSVSLVHLERPEVVVRQSLPLASALRYRGECDPRRRS
jgi:hypothetical protein